MKKLFLISLMMMLTSISAFATRNFSYDESKFNKHAVVYASFTDAKVTAQNYQIYAYAFIGDECRAKASFTSDNSGKTTFCFRIGVDEADAGKTVNFVLRIGDVIFPYSIYTLAETVTVSGTDETIGGIPSNPMKLNFVPIESITLESFKMYPKDTEDLTSHMTVTPSNANLPDELGWTTGNFVTHLEIDGNNVTAIKPSNPETLEMPYQLNYVTLNADGEATETSANATIQVYKPIESIEWLEQDKDPIIRIPLNNTINLDYISKYLKITPEDATEPLQWQFDKDVFLPVEGSSDLKASKIGTSIINLSSRYTKFDVTIDIYKPVTKLNVVTNTLYVASGTKLNDLLPHTFTIEPADATDPMSQIRYSVIAGEGKTLRTDADGSITAIASGSGQIEIAHTDIPNSPIIINIEVVQEPKDADFSFGANPLSVTLTQDQLSKENIFTILRDNFISTIWKDQIELLDGLSPFYLQEMGDAGLLYIDLKMNEAKASNYGSTKVGIKYYYTISVLNGSTIQNENREFSISYDLNIVQGLSAISVNPLTIGLEDTDAVITITTDPEGIILDDDKVQFSFTDGADGKPAVTIQRIAGTNQWKVTPESLVHGEYNATYGNLAANYEELSITQRILLKSGWHWVTAYANTQFADTGNDTDVFANAQELRTQDRLHYNDPTLGWFTSAPYIGYNEAAKIQVKDDMSLNILCSNMDNYSNDAVQKSLRPNWNWFAFPYCYDHAFKEVFDGQYALKMPDNSRIVSKDDGFATYVEGTWQGNLSVLRAGQAYMVFYANPESGDEISLAPESALNKMTNVDGTPALDILPDNNWDYKANDYADNMTIIASIAQDLEPGRYSIGSYVNGECRGKGEMVGDRFFVTVHGIPGEKVDFVLYDKATGKFHDITNSLTFGDAAGTYKAPVTFNTPNISGINDISGDTGIFVTIEGDNIVVKGGEAKDIEVFNLTGQRVSSTGLAAGTYVVRVITDQCVVTKKIVKK